MNSLAYQNTEKFVDELGIDRVHIFRVGDIEESVYKSFTLSKIGADGVTILMPDLPLDQVKCTVTSRLHTFRWLYVDGNSWYWPFALNVARERLQVQGENKGGYRHPHTSRNSKWGR